MFHIRTIICLAGVLLLCLAFSISAQVREEMPESTGTWIKDYNVYPVPNILLRYDRYSPQDVERFKAKLKEIRDAGLRGEWEDVYTYDFPDQVGTSELRLSIKSGFAEFYVYSCMPELRYLRYGRVEEGSDTIRLINEVAPNSPQTAGTITYVKVTWGNRRYLVEEESIKAFAEKAAGVYAEPDDVLSADYQKWGHYWVSGDLEKPIAGLPKLPMRYRYLQRSPLKTVITSVGERSVATDFSIANTTYSQIATYPVTLAAGKSAGVKPGIVFYLRSTDELIVIKDVASNTSKGILVRNIDDQNKDACMSSSLKTISCPKTMKGLTVVTKVGNFWW